MCAVIVLDTPRTTPYDRLADVASAVAGRKNPWNSNSWVETAKLGNQDEAFVRLLALEELRVIPSAAALRVTSRVLGLGDYVSGSTAHARIEIAKFVGIDKNANVLGAALHTLGRGICSLTEPDCGSCPIRKYCETRGAL